tara:strand:- start:68 stop:244 length:177 start_codon:yes stop_codon:yes gene_type:complete
MIHSLKILLFIKQTQPFLENRNLKLFIYLSNLGKRNKILKRQKLKIKKIKVDLDLFVL